MARILLALCCISIFASCNLLLGSVYTEDGKQHVRSELAARLQEVDLSAAAYCKAYGFKAMLMQYGMPDTSFKLYSTSNQANLFEVYKAHPRDRIEFSPINGFVTNDDIQYTTGTYLLTINEGETKRGQYISYWASVPNSHAPNSKLAVKKYLLIYNPVQ